jgi:HlyD family secretion protein
MPRFTPFLTLFLSAFLVFTVGAQESTKVKPKKPAAPAETPAKKAATHKVEKGPFKVEVSLKGIVESEAMNEVLMSPEAFTPENRGQFRVLKAVEHGAAVRKGDQIVWLDMERIDQIITDLERDRDLADLGFKLAQEDLHAAQKANPIDLAAAERGKKQADEDLHRYLSQDKDFLVKMIEYEVKSAANWLAYAKEELKHLEKMYKANDLTESTEEIILKRQRDMVERAAFYLKTAEYDRDFVLKVSLPRREEGMKENSVKQALTLEKTKITTPLLLSQKRLTLDKMKFDRERATEKLQKFKKDRDHMVVKAPADGIAYYGKCVRGNWSTSSVESKLQRGGMLMPDEVFLTVVKPRPIFVRATVDDKDFSNVRAGLQAKVVPTPLSALKLSAKVDKVSAVPVSGHFEAHVILQASPDSALMPGMACTVKLIAYQKSEALTVPSESVFTDENDEDVHYVFVQSKEDKHAKTYVALGKKSSTKVEILQGLQEGDEVLLENPTKTKK